MNKFASIFIRKDLTKEEKELFSKEIKVNSFILGLLILFIGIIFLLGLFIDDLSGDRHFEGKPIDYFEMIMAGIFCFALLCSRIIFILKRRKLTKDQNKI